MSISPRLLKVAAWPARQRFAPTGRGNGPNFDPYVTPLEVTVGEEGLIRVKVRQLVKNLAGETLFDGVIFHNFTIANGLIERMYILESEVPAGASPWPVPPR